ncbi:hypothetical protein PHLH5_35340 [Pseudomonas sp. Cab53]|nr:hypothetical protein PHLH5_35340 [Pseudomonas sp. Cab53]
MDRLYPPLGYRYSGAYDTLWEFSDKCSLPPA